MLNYGSRKLELDIPDNSDILEATQPEYQVDKKKFINRLVESIKKEPGTLSKVAIIVSDKTRLCDYHLYLPWVTDSLHEIGIHKDNIVFYIAYGTHPRQTDKESIIAYGDTYKKYHFIHHDCTDSSLYTELGVTRQNTPVKVRKDILQNSLIITMGAISHHYFAGFGGGRKLLFPGLGEKESVYHNHSLYLDFDKKILQPGCQPGKLKGNIIAEDLEEFDTYLPPRISIHGILDISGKVNNLLVGNDYNDFVLACNEHDKYYKYALDKEYDMVIASAGGYPKDINFIQSHKSIHNASTFVKEGGKIIILAECRDGIGTPGFLPLFASNNPDELFRKMELHYTGNGGTALAMMDKARKYDIYLYSSLDKGVHEKMGIKSVNTHLISKIVKENKGSLAVISNASMLIREEIP